MFHFTIDKRVKYCPEGSSLSPLMTVAHTLHQKYSSPLRIRYFDIPSKRISDEFIGRATSPSYEWRFFWNDR